MCVLILNFMCLVCFFMYFLFFIICFKIVLICYSVVEVVNFIFCLGGYIIVWDVGNFFFDFLFEKSNGD